MFFSAFLHEYIQSVYRPNWKNVKNVYNKYLEQWWAMSNTDQVINIRESLYHKVAIKAMNEQMS